MPTKRTIVVTALLTLLVAASGCSALSGDGGPSGAEIAERSNGAMQDVDTYTFEMSMSMSTDQADQTIDADATGAIDLANQRMRMEMDAAGQSLEQYVVGDTLYLNQRGTWQQQDISDQNIWEQQQLAQQQQLLDNASVTFEGNTTVDGTDVYELSVDVDEEQLMDVLEQQGQAIPGQVSLEDISYTMFVTHDEHYLKRMNADMSMSASGQSADVQMEMTFSDFNEEVSIELPPGAENAGSTQG